MMRLQHSDELEWDCGADLECDLLIMSFLGRVCMTSGNQYITALTNCSGIWFISQYQEMQVSTLPLPMRIRSPQVDKIINQS